MRRWLLFFLIICCKGVYAQVNIGDDKPTDPSAVLQLSSVSKGFLLPRMSTGARSLIDYPATGLIIFNTDFNQVQVNIGPPNRPDWQSLSYNSGLFQTQVTSVIQANNGLTITQNGDTIQLGGILKQLTTFYNSNNFVFNGLLTAGVGDTFFLTQNISGALTRRSLSALSFPSLVTGAIPFDNFIVADPNTGQLKKIPGKSVLVAANNGLLQIGGSTVQLGGVLNQLTTFYNSNNFVFNGLRTGTLADSFVVMQNQAGALVRRSLATLPFGNVAYGTIPANNVVLINPVTGQFQQIASTRFVLTANNGITKSGDSVVLGGSLVSPTVINTQGNNLSILGLKVGNPLTDSLVSVSSAGILGKLPVTFSTNVKPGNGLTKITEDSLILGGTLSTDVVFNMNGNAMIMNGLSSGNVTSDSLLVVSNGILKKINPLSSTGTLLDTANNGLTKSLDTIQLGGTLIKPTIINTSATNTLSIQGLSTSGLADTFIVAMNIDGKLTITNRSVNNGFFWSTQGNNGTNIPTNYMGTNDNQPLLFKVNSLPAGYLSNLSGSPFASSDNTYFGLNTGNPLGATNTGYRNTGIGSGTLKKSTSGNTNTGVGYNSLTNLTSGSLNTALGANALPLITQSSNNTAIGTNALASLSSNSSGGNLAIGYNAANNVTGGTNNIFIGANAGPSSLVALNNTLNIGNLIFGLNMPTVYGAKPTGNIGIGALNPTNRLYDSATRDPLRLGGLVLSNVKSDSLLFATSDSGIVRMISLNATAWKLLGNSGTNATNYLGTSDATDFQIRTNGVNRIYTVGVAGATQGFVGIGTTNPTNQLTVSGVADPLKLLGLETSGDRTDSFVVVNNGVLRLRNANQLLDTAYNGLTKNLDTVLLGGSLNRPTAIQTSA
ncbi:MAG: hypothetical protein QM528_02355, partial [Phycisphaerales bacterium]|nr:hypothetical protein [Phycisphaerales bacterium]